MRDVFGCKHDDGWGVIVLIVRRRIYIGTFELQILYIS